MEWHGHRDGMDTGMAWTQGWHGHSNAMGHSDTRTTRPDEYGLDVRRRLEARCTCSSLRRNRRPRRGPCASRAPSESTASPSKSPRCSTSRSSGCAASIDCRSRLKPQVGRSSGRCSLAGRRHARRASAKVARTLPAPLPNDEALAQVLERPRHQAKQLLQGCRALVWTKTAKNRRTGGLRASSSVKATMSPSFSPLIPPLSHYLTWPVLLTYLFSEGT